jgi:hypothetical protein
MLGLIMIISQYFFKMELPACFIKLQKKCQLIAALYGSRKERYLKRKLQSSVLAFPCFQSVTSEPSLAGMTHRGHCSRFIRVRNVSNEDEGRLIHFERAILQVPVNFSWMKKAENHEKNRMTGTRSELHHER